MNDRPKKFIIKDGKRHIYDITTGKYVPSDIYQKRQDIKFPGKRMTKEELLARRKFRTTPKPKPKAKTPSKPKKE